MRTRLIALLGAVLGLGTFAACGSESGGGTTEDAGLTIPAADAKADSTSASDAGREAASSSDATSDVALPDTSVADAADASLDAGPACDAGATCLGNGAGTSRVGVISCADGGATCVDGPPVDDGTVCAGPDGGARLCTAGACLAPTVVSGNVNLSTATLTPGRTCVSEAPAFDVTGLTATTATVAAAPTGDCPVTGDEVLLVNLQGAGAAPNTADTTVRFGSAIPVSSNEFVSSSSGRIQTDRLLGTNDDKTVVIGSLEIRGPLGTPYSYFVSSNLSSLWVEGTTNFQRDWTLQADGTAVTFNGVISGNGSLSRRSNGATVYFNAENTYDGGTLFTGGGRNLLGSYEGNQVTHSNTAKLGLGHVFIAPLATFQINDAGNLRSGQNYYVGSNLSWYATLSLPADLSLEQVRLRALGLGGIQNGRRSPARRARATRPARRGAPCR